MHLPDATTVVLLCTHVEDDCSTQQRELCVCWLALGAENALRMVCASVIVCRKHLHHARWFDRLLHLSSWPQKVWCGVCQVVWLCVQYKWKSMWSAVVETAVPVGSWEYLVGRVHIWIVLLLLRVLGSPSHSICSLLNRTAPCHAL